MNEHGGKRPGAGRPKTGKNTQQISLTLTKEQAKMLKEKATYDNVSISKYIIKMLDLETEDYRIEKE